MSSYGSRIQRIIPDRERIEDEHQKETSGYRYSPNPMTREFKRIDLLPSWADPTARRKGCYLDIALLHQTPRRLCALASRLSHESWEKSTEDTDKSLLERLASQGEEHGKSLRGHVLILAIEGPRYWWVEMDAYTVGVIPMGSTSTMYGEAKRLSGEELVRVKSELPEGTLQLRIRAFSEQTLQRIIKQQKNHRLPEWQEFCSFVEHIIN